MAATIRLVTFSGQTVTPKNDAIVYDASLGRCGVFYGCDVTASGNVIYVSSGYGMIRGRFFEIEASTLSVTLSSTDTLLGRVYVRLDLSNTESPVQLLTVTGSSLPALEQDTDANFVDGVWEMELATFSVTTTEVSNVSETYVTITDNGSQIDALDTNKINGVTSARNVAVTITNGTLTVPRSGWLVVEANCNDGVSLAPFLEVRAANGVALNSAWGITASGSKLRVAIPAKKGQTYSVYAVRCTAESSARLHY